MKSGSSLKLKHLLYLMINEIFKEGLIGQDLENALLLLCNGIKDTFHIPEFMIKQNICTIFK